MVKQEIDWLELMVQVLIEKFKPGQLISHHYLAKMLNIKKPVYKNYETQSDFEKALEKAQFKYMEMVDKLRWEILEKQYLYLRNVRGDGYIFLNPKDQTTFAKKQAMETVYKGLKTGAIIMQHIRYDALTQDEKRKNADELAKLGQLHQMIKTHK